MKRGLVDLWSGIEGFMKNKDAQIKISIIGLGYVGLPLAHAFSEKYKVVGLDVNKARIDELNSCYDRTLELTTMQIKKSLMKSMFTISSQHQLVKTKQGLSR